MNIDISAKLNQKPGFEVIPKRWVVERTFSWFNNCRRLAKDYEVSSHISQQIIIIAAIKIRVLPSRFKTFL